MVRLPNFSLECFVRNGLAPLPPCEEGKLFLLSLTVPFDALARPAGIGAPEVEGLTDLGLALLLAALTRFASGVTLLLSLARGSRLVFVVFPAPAARNVEVEGEALANDAAVGLLNPPLSRSCVAEAERGGC